MKRAIVSVGVSASRVLGPYVNRFERTFREYGSTDRMIIWDQDWPPGSLPHGDCNYAFKVHAVSFAAQQGYTSILWFDASCHAIASLEPLWQRVEREGHVLIEDANSLGNWSSDASLEQFGVSRDDAMKIRLMCGTCWGLDLTTERSRLFLTQLRDLATPENFNGTHKSRHPGLAQHPRPGTGGAAVSTDGRCWGHRSDEVYMSLLARKLGMEAIAADQEFVGGNTVSERSCVRSGYDL